MTTNPNASSSTTSSSGATSTSPPNITLSTDQFRILVQSLLQEARDQPATQPPVQVPRREDIDHRDDFPSYGHDHAIRDRPTAKDYFPTLQELEFSPLLDQSTDPEDFSFFETRDPDRVNRTTNYAVFPFHATQKYAPRPLATDARHSKLTKEVDSHFVKAQKGTAHLTRPLDLLLHQCLQTDDYEEVLELLMYHAAELNESRNHFLRKDRGLPQKETVTPILSLKTIAEERKAFNAINKTMGFNNGNNNNNNNNSNNNNNGNWNQNNRNSSQRQGNNQQQRNNFAHNKNSNSFNNNNGNNNRSINTTTHSDQGKGNNRGQSRGRSQSRYQGQQ
ncbi:hypothetical protein BGZ52_004917 [Haplosporangium bisporale]|nr:hypothetical protein BGZ52_004917 [Haplosporangium bisporale]